MTLQRLWVLGATAVRDLKTPAEAGILGEGFPIKKHSAEEDFRIICLGMISLAICTSYSLLLNEGLDRSPRDRTDPIYKQEEYDFVQT